jgi:hypothetical protein
MQGQIQSPTLKQTQMKLRPVMTILLVNAVLFVSAFFALTYWAIERLPKTRAQFMTPEQVIFYKKYAAEVNHLRMFDFQKHMHQDADKDTIDFLFSKVGDGKRTVLIQGDSWAEQMILGHQSFIALQIFSEQHDTRFIVGGTNSYAPSLMAVQYRLLKQDFALQPEVVVGIIDQTDMGDELCRYRLRQSKNKAGEDVVLPYDEGAYVPYLLHPYFDLIDILDRPGNPLLKLIEYRLVKSKTMPPSGCYKEILSPLEGQLTELDRRYVESKIAAYLKEVFRAPTEVKKLVLVTHHHKKHETGEYTISVAELVKKSIEESVFKDRIVHLDFGPQDYAKEEQAKVFRAGDPFSHLTDYAHRKVFTSKILREVGALPQGH